MVGDEKPHPDAEGPTAIVSPAGPGEPTHSAAAASSTSFSSIPPSATTSSTGASAQEVLTFDSVGKVRLLVLAILVLAAVGLTLIATIGGSHPMAQAIFVGTLGLLVVTLGWLFFWLRNRRHVTETVLGVVGVVCGLACGGMLLFWGVYSPAAMIISLGLYFYATLTSFRVALLLYVVVAGFHALIWGATMAGLIPDAAIVQGSYMRVEDQVASFFMPQVVYAVAFALARLARRSTLKSLNELDDAVRRVAVREALLNEARLSLDRVHGGPGLLTGQQIGEYRLGPVIGRGGMGEVYEAIHVASEKRAAVKVLHRHMLGDRERQSRLLREAEIVASLDATNIARVLAFSGPDEPMPFIAMELLSGEDLGGILRERAALDLGEAVELVQQVAGGLASAHRQGIIHRDIKPSNLFRASTPNGSQWKILDFGVSKLAASTGTLTRGGVVGTPAYMAPEQAEGRRVDVRADQYALAMVAYRCVTGQPGFAGEVDEILAAARNEMPVRPSAHADVPRELDAVFALALAKRPEDRFESVGELAEAFTAAVDGTLDETTRRRAARLQRKWPWRDPD